MEERVKQLERHQYSCEKYIQYLHKTIENLESQQEQSEQELQSLNNNLAKTRKQLKNSERLCNDKEKFILFRESQLSESENTIYELRQRIEFLSSKMSTGELRPRSRSGSRSRAEIISLETLPNDRLLEKINTSAEELLRFARGEERLQTTGEADHLRNQITRASEIIGERYDSIRAETADEIAEYKANILRLEESLRGAFVELEEHSNLITDLENDLRNSERESNEFQNDLRQLLAEWDRLEGNYDILIDGLQQQLNRSRIETAERDILLNQSNTRLEDCRNERGYMSALYRAERTVNKSLVRQRLALKIANRQLQIRLLNPPIAPIPAPPQQIDQIWLLLQ